jgi:hypothetical protein
LPKDATLKDRVFAFLKLNPTAGIGLLRANLPGEKAKSLENLLTQWRHLHPVPKQPGPKSPPRQKNPPRSRQEKLRGGRGSRQNDRDAPLGGASNGANRSDTQKTGTTLDPSKKDFWIQVMRGAFEAGDFTSVIRLGEKMNSIPTVQAEDPQGLTEAQLRERARGTLADHSREITT